MSCLHIEISRHKIVSKKCFANDHFLILQECLKVTIHQVQNLPIDEEFTKDNAIDPCDTLPDSCVAVFLIEKIFTGRDQNDPGKSITIIFNNDNSIIQAYRLR